jgi:hypothetical protein
MKSAGAKGQPLQEFTGADRHSNGDGAVPP